MTKCILCGIDSSTNKTGISKFVNGKYNDSYLIDVSKSKNKFDDMSIGIIKRLDAIKPNIIAIERMHTIININTFRNLCEMLGVIRWYCIENKIEYIELSPTEWRKYSKSKIEIVPKKRTELKIWSINRVKELYGVDVSDDVSDSILIGLAYVNKMSTLCSEEL